MARRLALDILSLRFDCNRDDVSQMKQRNVHRTPNVRRLRSRVSDRAFSTWKQLYQLIRWRSARNKAILFIVGCQRSGTTLMQEIFDRDLNAKAYGEFSELSSMDRVHGIRLNPLEDVKRVIDRDRAPLVVLKPLVETQNLLKLLAYFPRSRALFLYRHYRDVASSIIQKFGAESPIDHFGPVLTPDPTNWRSEGVTQRVRDTVAAHFSTSMSPSDAAALVWWVRNSLYFDLRLDENAAVMLCKYEDLVKRPAQVMSRIYRFAGVDFDAGRNIRQVHTESIAKGKGIVLSPQIENLCSGLLDKLQDRYRRQVVS